MFLNNDKLYMQCKDMPTLKAKIDRAIELSRELANTLQDLELYNLEFEIKKEEI